MEKKVLVPVADGTEEMEAVTIIDVLRRAGADVTVASVDGIQITASRGVKIIADELIDACQENTYDLIALPGGIPGAEHLRDSAVLAGMLKKQAEEGRFYAAICASPAVILEHHGLLEGRFATCHPGFVKGLSNQEKLEMTVVHDKNCVTSRGAGTALPFSLKLVELLYGKEKLVDVAGPMVIDVS